jgi:hypothetical protein
MEDVTKSLHPRILDNPGSVVLGVVVAATARYLFELAQLLGRSPHAVRFFVNRMAYRYVQCS